MPMYSLRYHVYPLLDNQAEVRSFVEEKVRQYQSEGVRSTCLSAVVSESGPVVVAINQFEHLAELESWMAHNQNEAQRAWLSKLNPMLRQPGKQNLYENLLLAPTDAARVPSRYIRRIVRVPGIGKGAQLREKVLELTRLQQEMGVAIGCAVQVTGEAQGTVTTNTFFDNLAAFEESRANIQSSAATQRVLQEINAALAANSALELYSILVPFQS
jgi:hypothetical protein